MIKKLSPLLWSAAIVGSSVFVALPASAKLPPPSDEAKAKAAEAAAKTAHGGKVDGYKLCKSMDTTAAGYYATAKKEGKDVKPPVATPPCADPGPFVYTPAPPASAAAPVAAAAPSVPAAPAVAAAPKK